MVKKILIIVLGIAVLGTGFFVFSKYGEDFNPFIADNQVEPVYNESQTVHLSMEKVRTLNPITSKDSDTYQLSKLIFRSLFSYDENLSLMNDLAESYTYDEKKSSVNIRIKSDSYFSNGNHLTASDVKYSIDQYIAAAAAGNTVYGDYVTNIKSVSVNKNDKYAFTVQFKDQRDVSMDNFVFPIVSEKSFVKTAASKVVSNDFIPIGSGPYAVEKYNNISELVLSANSYYPGTKPSNTLILTILPEQKDVIPLLEVNNISVGFLEELSRDTLISDKKITTENYIANEVEVVGYNFAKENMANKQVRQAIAFAIDTKELNESAYYKNIIPCDTLYFPGYLGAENTGDNYAYDMEKASKLLVSAGYADLDGNGYLEDVNENELTIEILVNGESQSRVTAAESIKDSLDKLFIVSRIIYAENSQDFNSKLRTGGYDVFISGIKINETYDLRSLLHSNYNNVLGYSNPKADLLLDKLKSGISQEEKKETLEATKEILIDDLPYYCIGYETYGALIAESLQGNNNIFMFNNIYNGCDTWFCKYEVSEKPRVVDSTTNTNNPNKEE